MHIHQKHYIICVSIFMIDNSTPELTLYVRNGVLRQIVRSFVRMLIRPRVYNDSLFFQ